MLKKPKSEYDPTVPNVICPLCAWEGPMFDKNGKASMICPKCKSGKLGDVTTTDKEYKESRIKSFSTIIAEQGEMENYECPKCKAGAVAEKGKPLKTTKCSCGGTFVKTPTNLTEYTTLGELNDISDLVDAAQTSGSKIAEIISRLDVKFGTDFEDDIYKLLERISDPGGEAIMNSEDAGNIRGSLSQLGSAISTALTSIDSITNSLRKVKTPGDVTQ